MSTNNFRLIIISHEQKDPEEIETVIALLESGLDVFHLRKPSWEMNDYDLWLDRIPKGLLCKITIHEHFDLAKKWNLGGVHQKSYQKLNPENGLRNSKSFHDLETIKTLDAKSFDYVTFSPVYESITKVGYRPKYSSLKIDETIDQSRVNVVALGGITKKNLSELKKRKFNGAAILGDFWRIEGLSNRLTYFNECTELIV